MTPIQYVRIGLLVLVVLLFPLGYLKGCSDEKERFDAYKEMVAAAGKAQEERTAAIRAHDELLKEEADEGNRLERDRLRATIDRLRRERAGSSFVPAAAACPERPASACFNGPELERALRDLDSGLQGLVDEGSRAVIDLDTAREWAHRR